MNILQKLLSQDAVNNLQYDDRKLSDLVALEVGTIGENMRLRRAIFFPELEGQYLNSFVHNSGENLKLNYSNFQFFFLH